MIAGMTQQARLRIGLAFFLVAGAAAAAAFFGYRGGTVHAEEQEPEKRSAEFTAAGRDGENGPAAQGPELATDGGAAGRRRGLLPRPHRRRESPAKCNPFASRPDRR